MHRRLVLLIALGVVSCAGRSSAGEPAVVQRWPLVVSVHAGSLGFYPASFNPGLQAGTEWVWRRRGVHVLTQTVSLGTVFFRDNMVGGNLETGLSNRFQTPVGLYLEVGLSLGYQLTMIPARTYVLSESEGARVGGNVPRSMARARLSLGLGYELTRLARLPVTVFASYSVLGFAPYAPANGIPAMLAAQVTAGVSIPLTGAL